MWVLLILWSNWLSAPEMRFERFLTEDKCLSRYQELLLTRRGTLKFNINDDGENLRLKEVPIFPPVFYSPVSRRIRLGMLPTR